MGAQPVFVTQYEVLRTSDYVLITLSAPTGEVVDGKMQVEPVQQVALTLSRFTELAGLMNEIARKIGAPDPQGGWRRSEPTRPRRPAGEADEEPADESDSPGDFVIRH